MRFPQALTLSLLALAAAAACSKKPETAPVPAVNADSIAKAHAADSAAAAAAAATAAEKARTDSLAKLKEDSAAMVNAKMNMLTMAVTSTIYFDFDKSTLTDSAKLVLDKKIAALNANPSVGIQVAGNTDERGSSEYNLALGQQRAATVKRYLTQHGIADSRITIISFGLERPVALGHDEASWAKNRRAEFTIEIGQLKLMTP